MLDAICRILNKHRKKFIRIDGQCSSTHRKTSIDMFQLKDDCIAAVLSITAANTGITLTAAHLVLFAELHWNPSVCTTFCNEIYLNVTLKINVLHASITRNNEMYQKKLQFTRVY